MTLLPGQYPNDGFPRFGTHLHRPPPAVPVDPVIEMSGAVGKSFALPLAELATLPRRQVTYRPLGQLRSGVLSEWRRS